MRAYLGCPTKEAIKQVGAVVSTNLMQEESDQLVCHVGLY